MRSRLAAALASAPASTDQVLPAGIVPVLGITCSDVECSYHESLHTADPGQAKITARQLGWRLMPEGPRCPLCVASMAETMRQSYRVGKAVRS